MAPTDPDPPRWPPRAAPPAAADAWRPAHRWALASGYVDSPAWWPPAGRTSPRRSHWQSMPHTDRYHPIPPRESRPMSPPPAADQPDPATGYGLWILGVAFALVGPDFGQLLADLAHVASVVTSLVAFASLGLSACDRLRHRLPARGRPRPDAPATRTRVR